MSFWDPKYLEEQKKKREEEERRRRMDQEAAKARRRRRDAQERKAREEKKKKKALQEELERQRQEELDSQNADSEKSEEDEWKPPVLSRGFGGGFGLQRLLTNKDAQEQIKKNEMERQRKALEEKAAAGSEQEIVPRLNRPF